LIGPFDGGSGPGPGRFGFAFDPLGFMAVPPAQASFFLPVSFYIFIGGLDFLAGQGTFLFRLLTGLDGRFLQLLVLGSLFLLFGCLAILIFSRFGLIQFIRAFFLVADYMLDPGAGWHRPVGEVDDPVFILVNLDFTGQNPAAPETYQGGSHDQARDQVYFNVEDKMHGVDLHHDPK